MSSIRGEFKFIRALLMEYIESFRLGYSSEGESPKERSVFQWICLDSDDLYVKYKKLQQQLEFLEVQEEYIKDEMRNLRKEYIHAQEEVKRI